MLPQAQLRDILRHEPDIDSLRAVAMLGVVAMHAKILPFGWAGVWLFFVISGYVVTLSIVRNRDPADPVKGARHFFWQRVGRILPPYYAYIAIGLAWSLAMSIPQPAGAVASLMGFFNNITMVMGSGEMTEWPTGHLWTISVEMQFYLVYGLVAFFAPMAVTRRVLWAFVFLAPLARFMVGTSQDGADPEAAAYLVYAGPAVHFDSFAIGCLFAMARVSTPAERLVRPVVMIGAAALALYFAAYVGVNILVRDREGIDVIKDVISGILYGQGREVFVYTALGLGAAALLALTVIHHPFVRPITRIPALHYIGRISYGCYIYHALCLRFATFIVSGKWKGIEALSIPSRVAVFAIALVLTIGIAQLSWKFIEQPALKLVRNRSRTKEPIRGEVRPAP